MIVRDRLLRDRVKTRRRKLLSFAAGAGLIAALAMTPLASGGSLVGFKAVRDLASLIGDRSPGKRSDDNLKFTKQPRKKPEQQALAKETAPPEEAPRIFYFKESPEFDPGKMPELNPFRPDLRRTRDFPPPKRDGVVIAQNSVPAAVPEPATWVSFIVGFGLTGAMLRYRKRKACAS